MIFKSKAKKSEIEAIEMADRATDGIAKIVDRYQELEIANVGELGRAVDFNYPRVYIYMMCNYGEDISALYAMDRYPSLYTLYCDFMRCYGICKALRNSYFKGDESEYEKLIKSLFTLTLVQRKSECENYMDDYADSHREEIEFFKIRYEQMKGIISQYFSDVEHNFDEINPTGMYEIIEALSHEFNMSLDADKMIMDAVNSNEELSESDKKNAIKIFISSKSAKENNIQTVITRIIGDINGQKALILNKKENMAPKMIVIVEKILRDVVRQVEENFDFG